MKKLILYTLVFYSLNSFSQEPCPGMPIYTDPRDGKEYGTVKIGDQCWMRDNLNFETKSGSWMTGFAMTRPRGRNVGRLYDWETAMAVCPPGWRLASYSDWLELKSYVGEHPGKKLASSDGWIFNNGEDSYGFTALPGGERVRVIGIHMQGLWATWWTSNEHSRRHAYMQRINNDLVMERDAVTKRNGYSVRCIKDSN